MNPDSLMQNPALSGIDPGKLQLLLSMPHRPETKNKTSCFPF